jgi:hypothetical protein
MDHPQVAVWSILFGLSLMLIGGLMLWAYSLHRPPLEDLQLKGPESDSARRFHSHLSRWFFLYGVVVTTLGLIFLLSAGSVFI